MKGTENARKKNTVTPKGGSPRGTTSYILKNTEIVTPKKGSPKETKNTYGETRTTLDKCHSDA